MQRAMVKIVEMRPDISHSFVFTSSDAMKERNSFKEVISTILAERQLRATVGATPTTTASSPAGSPVVSDTSAPGTPRLNALSRMGPGGGSSLARRGLNGAGPPVELKARFELLKQNKELATLHKELVMGKHVSEEEFWESRKHLLRNKAAMDRQQKGQSSAWLDLKPETGESNDVKYVMTPQVIHSVCQQYPSIKRAYDSEVPDKLSEAEFWKRYFQSRFFHRSRSGRGANEPDDDIFDRALEEDEEETKHPPKRIKLDHINRLVDLSTTEEDHFESYTSPDSTMAAGKTKESKEAMPLIRRFNRYAQRVLNSTIGPKKSSSTSDAFNPFDIPDSTFDTLMSDVKTKRAKMMPPKDGSQLLPAHLYQEALSCHAAGNEILRHFWASTSPDKVAKHLRMVESLKKIREENVKSLMIQANSLNNECVDAMIMMLKPMQTAITKALKHAEATKPKSAVPHKLA
ncbi:RNA polymerase II transcription factor B subunit 1 [Entomortierella lignicola]|nr:RNA polymerase II transcription factor B subunit 1 [Entomortierella lignicola]